MNCYQCVHRGTIPGDTHSQCFNPEAKVGANAYGVAQGWCFWPINFDPLWIISCDGFEPRQQKTEQNTDERKNLAV